MRAMNLLPPEERGGARPAGTPGRLTAVHGIAGVGALVTVGMLGSWAMAKQDTSSAREAEAAAVTRSATAQAQVDRLAPVVAFDARRQARESSVLQLAAGRTDWASVLRATAGSLPASVTLTTMKLAAADATGATSTTTATTGTTPTGDAGSGTVTLSLCADSQPRVATTLRRLRALPQVADVALSQTSRSASGASSGATASASGAGCTAVAADAALGLSAATLMDGAGTPAATTATGTTTTPGAPATPATTTTGTSR